MATRNRSNLDSRNDIATACDVHGLDAWLDRELASVTAASHAELVRHVVRHFDEFVRWPSRALLLWEGCTREQDYHSYPTEIKAAAKQRRFTLDTRTNGPATAAFVLAGGERPSRFGSSNAWSSHHIYSGKFPHAGRAETLHAKYDGRHFTQSAGVVAIHPVADALCDEYPAFSWLVRAHAFRRLGYDPDRVFALSGHDPYGFVEGRVTEVLFGGGNPSGASPPSA
jgi:hypothetical protein